MNSCVLRVRSGAAFVPLPPSFPTPAAPHTRAQHRVGQAFHVHPRWSSRPTGWEFAPEKQSTAMQENKVQFTITQHLPALHTLCMF